MDEKYYQFIGLLGFILPDLDGSFTEIQKMTECTPVNSTCPYELR